MYIKLLVVLMSWTRDRCLRPCACLLVLCSDGVKWRLAAAVTSEMLREQTAPGAEEGER